MVRRYLLPMGDAQGQDDDPKLELVPTDRPGTGDAVAAVLGGRMPSTPPYKGRTAGFTRCCGRSCRGLDGAAPAEVGGDKLLKLRRSFRLRPEAPGIGIDADLEGRLGVDIA